MISVPWPPMLAPPLLAPPEPLPARSAELPDPLDPDAPERDCSLPVDSRDWAIDHSFFENWERPGGRPPERSSSLLRRASATRGRNGLLGTIRISCAYQSRRVLSCSPRASARGDCILGGVRTPLARPVHDESQSGREPLGDCRRCSFTRSPGFPLPSPGPRPQRDPGCHPGRGLTLSVRPASKRRLAPPELSPRCLVHRSSRGLTRPATVHA